MNEECIYCGGSGYLTNEKIEIIKIYVEPSKLEKEHKELQAYLHPKHVQKLYVTEPNPPKKGKKGLKGNAKKKKKNVKSKSKKKKKTLNV
jgi:hypothetical protein